MSFKSWSGTLENAFGSWLGFGIFILIWIGLLVFDTQIFRTSSAWLRSAQRSSVPKFDSDLFCLEKLISWDWLREADLLNSIITKTCFTQKKIYPNFASLFRFWRYTEYPCPLNPHLGLWFDILILIWIWSLIFDTPIIQILALYLDF